MRKLFLLIVIGLGCLACKSEKSMDIRYTSLNDYYADYVFDLDNDVKGLKQINKYVLSEIQNQKRVVDSFKKASYKPRLTQEDMVNKGSFSLKADDIILYTSSNENVVIEYKVGKESFKVEKIIVGENYHTSQLAIEVAKVENECMLTIPTESLNLEELYQVLNKIQLVGYHKQLIDFKYLVKDVNNVSLLEVMFTDKGKHIQLNYL